MHWQLAEMRLTYCGFQSTWEQASGGMPFPKNRLIVSLPMRRVGSRIGADWSCRASGYLLGSQHDHPRRRDVRRLERRRIHPTIRRNPLHPA
jgi:hypothetical protein